MPGNLSQISSLLPNHYGNIRDITGDSHGNIWASTQDGLLKISDAILSENLSEKNIELKGTIVSTALLPDSNILLLTKRGFYVGYFDKSKQYFKLKIIKKGGDIIDAYTTDDKGNVWLATRFGKIYRFKNGKLDDMSKLLHPSTLELFYSSAYDKKKQRLFFSGDPTLLFGNENHIGVFIPSNTRKQLPPETRILTTEAGKVLIHLPGEGIFLIDEKDNLLPLWLQPGEKLYGLLYEDKEQNIWFADKKTGLRQFRFGINGKLDLINIISKKDGLQDNAIFSISSDFMHRILLTTPSGLDILQKDKENKWRVFNYSKSAGLNLKDWSYVKLLTDNKGDIWMNSPQELIRFDPKNISLKNEIPKVVIEKVQINLRDVDWSLYTDSFFGYRQFPVNPKLKYADNTVSIHFNNISFSSTSRPEYSYQLFPFDTAWSLPNTTASVSFVNLSPGNYEFKVRTRDLASGWSEPALFAFTIATPFWMRWWFITLCILIAAGIIYSIYKYRINQLKKLLAIRTKISRDLHDEIGSALSSIHILSKVSQSNLEKDKSKAAGLLQKITEQSADMQQSMSDIVWSIRPDNDKIENLVTRMREYLGQTAEPKNMLIDFFVDEKLSKESLTMQQRQHVFLIFKEAVNNAVKYSQGKKISVLLGKENNHIRLLIKDDGLGFDPDKITSSSGLKNMKDRAKELKGTLHILSSLEKGTQIELLCPAT